MRSTADVGLSSFSATGFGLEGGFVDAFLARGFAFVVTPPELSLDFERVRTGFFRGASASGAAMSFKGTFVVLARGEKKSLVTACASRLASFGAYWPVTKSVMVRGFFLGAFPFSGDDARDAV
jgi:hypothetical protein